MTKISGTIFYVGAALTSMYLVYTAYNMTHKDNPISVSENVKKLAKGLEGRIEIPKIDLSLSKGDSTSDNKNYNCDDLDSFNNHREYLNKCSDE